MFAIVAHKELAPKVHQLSIEAPLVAQRAKPGQFVIIIADEKGERVPFTISGWNPEAGTVDFVFIEVGKTTRQLAALGPGDSISHFVGPLGRAAEIDHYGHVVSVVSGYGVSAMVPVLSALREKGNRITTILQAPDRDRVFGEAEIGAVSDRLLFALGTSSNGDSMNSSATLAMRKLLDKHPRQPVDRVVAMGSICLMRLICDMTREPGIKTLIHLTPLMVDGTGMCGACRLSVQGKNRFACVHGPEFDGHEVDGWEVLMARRCTYADESILQQGFQCRGCSQW